MLVLEIIEKLENVIPQTKKTGLFANEIGSKEQNISKIKKDIVNNNLYGVDLNNESVEITKLGLWLKSASKNDTLALLNDTIKCGNSLISDFSISDKAFDWNTEFSEIMREGGFDVIVGNPPYVVIKGGRFLEGYQYTDEEIMYIREHYQTAEQQVNTYILFVEKAVQLMNNKTYVSVIVPNTFLANEYSKKFRNYLLEKTQIVDIYNLGLVFEDANVETLILTLNQNKINKTKLKIANKEIFIDLLNISKLTTDQKFILHIDEKSLPLIYKIKQFPLLSDFAKVSMGISTGNNKKYLSKVATNDKFKKIISGSEVSRYFLHHNVKFVYYEPDLLDRSREESIFLTPEKLISKFVGTSLTFCYDNQQHYVLNTACSLILKNNELHIKYLLALLNSKLLDWYFHIMFSDYRETFPIMKSGNIECLPIPKISLAEQQPFVEFADKMLEYHHQVYDLKRNFLELVKSELKVGKITNKLDDWSDCSWDEFSDELKKANVKLGMKELSEWKQFYSNEKSKVQNYVQQIISIDNQINNAVFKLYNIDNFDEIFETKSET